MEHGPLKPHRVAARLAVGLLCGGAFGALGAATALPAAGPASPASPAARANPAGLDWVALPQFDIVRTETTVAQVRRYVQATGHRSAAEAQGGGQHYDGGWVTLPGAHWARPFGQAGRAAHDDEPAVHLNFTEAQAFCRWAGGQLPSAPQWWSAAYTEQRPTPPAPWVAGRRYRYPIGDSPAGAQCLQDCGPEAARRGQNHGFKLPRGHGPALAGRTPAGVNGLHEMAGNLWEWVDSPANPGDNSPDAERLTLGGSWWYGEAPMRAEHRQGKPPATTVVYIGFRCVRAR